MGNKKWTVTSEKFLSQEQILILIDYLARERDLAIARGTNQQAIKDYYALRTMLESGVRVQEFCAIKHSDFAGLKLLIRNGKGGKTRTILLTRPTANLLKEWINVKIKLKLPIRPDDCLFPSRYGEPYTTRGIRKRVKLIFAALSFPTNLSCHAFRHTYCAMLLEAKVGLGTVRDNMGHSSISVTNIYSHACGSLENIEVFGQGGTEFCKKAELEKAPNTIETNKNTTPVSLFLSKRNLK